MWRHSFHHEKAVSLVRNLLENPDPVVTLNGVVHFIPDEAYIIGLGCRGNVYIGYQTGFGFVSVKRSVMGDPSVACEAVVLKVRLPSQIILSQIVIDTVPPPNTCLLQFTQQ